MKSSTWRSRVFVPPIPSNALTKDEMILTEIAKNHDPDLSRYSKRRLIRLQHLYRTEKIVEICLARCSNGLYRWINASGRDFDDNSDGKTASIDKKSLMVHVYNVGTKIGALRTVVYNPFFPKFYYFFLPSTLTKGKTRMKRGIKILSFPWYPRNDNFGEFDEFRVPDFKTLARMENR